MNALFCSTAVLDRRSGGGNVSIHEMSALEEFCDDVDYYDKTSISSAYLADPFIMDKLVAGAITTKYDLVHFNGNPWREVVKKVRGLNPDVKVVSSVPAHSLEESIREHEDAGINYEQYYPHLIHRWDEYTEHIRESDLIIYPSNYSKNYLTEKMGLTNRSVVIPHGVDLPKKRIKQKRGFDIAYIGAWGPDKGVKYLVDAWSQLDYNDSTLIFFGQGSREMREWLVPMAKGGKYHLYGGYYDLPEIMPKFSIVVVPSVSEGFNIGALEGMAYGKPVVISSTAGASEVAVGQTVSPRNVDELKAAIASYKEDEDLLRKHGKAAFKAAKKYSWTKIEKRYEKEYGKL